MAHPPIIYADSFMPYATADLAIAGWTSLSGKTVSNSGGRGGRGVCSTNAATFGYAGLVRGFPSSTVASVALAHRSSGGAKVATLGGVTVAIGSTGAVSLAGVACGVSVPFGSWSHFELIVTPTGHSLYLNETLIGSATTSHSAMTSVTLCDTTDVGGGSSECCDVVIMASNDTGNTDPLGDRAAIYRAPTGAGSHTDWTPNSGANYAAVDDTNEDGDTSYVASATPGDRDSYALEDLPAGAASVQAVLPILCARKTDAGTRSLSPVLRVGGTDYDQAAVNLGTDYVYLPPPVIELNPDTGVAWTPSDVNGMELGVLVAS